MASAPQGAKRELIVDAQEFVQRYRALVEASTSVNDGTRRPGFYRELVCIDWDAVKVDAGGYQTKRTTMKYLYLDANGNPIGFHPLVLRFFDVEHGGDCYRPYKAADGKIAKPAANIISRKYTDGRVNDYFEALEILEDVFNTDLELSVQEKTIYNQAYMLRAQKDASFDPKISKHLLANLNVSGKCCVSYKDKSTDPIANPYAVLKLEVGNEGKRAHFNTEMYYQVPDGVDQAGETMYKFVPVYRPGEQFDFETINEKIPAGSKCNCIVQIQISCTNLGIQLGRKITSLTVEKSQRSPELGLINKFGARYAGKVTKVEQGFPSESSETQVARDYPTPPPAQPQPSLTEGDVDGSSYFGDE